MKTSTRLFWKSALWTGVVLTLVLTGVYAVGESWRQMQRIGSGEYKTAVEYHDGLLRILDFEWRL